MSLFLSIVGMVLLLFQLLLLARAALDWSVALAGPPASGSARQQVSYRVRAMTEPVLGPVRRVLPPLRLGPVGLDTAFIAVFVAVIVLRQIVLSL
ncbi:MAG: YggT family protein [Micromonosporaceae bacterium]|nr:YggT family protein [Micromonosporaceae bacterium]